MSERKVNLKDNIWIEGFDNSLYLEVWRNCDRNPVHWKNIIYSGKTSKIPEDVARKCVVYYGKESDDYKNYQYKDTFGDDYGILTAKESIQSACKKEYCVIYRLD